LGDIVQTVSTKEDGDHMLGRRVISSGRYASRIWFGESEFPQARVEAQLRGLGALLERSSANLLAVDTATVEQNDAVGAYLTEQHNLGRLMFERAN
jgi:hypothetical protein